MPPISGPADARVLHESEYFRVERLPNPSIVRVTRLTKAFENADGVERACRPIQDCLNLLGRSRLRLLVDSRPVVGQNDPASEASFAEHRKELSRGFVRVAIIVRTTAGMLQAKRLVVADGAPPTIRVFLEEEPAMIYLSETHRTR